MKIKSFLFVFLFIFTNIFSSSCIHKRPSNFFELKYSKGACKGRCPVFELKVRGDQIVSFNGKKYTDIVGLVFIKLSDKKYKELHNIIVESKFLEKPSVVYKRPANFPMTVLEVTRGYSSNKQIIYNKHSLSLDRLIKFLDELVIETQH